MLAPRRTFVLTDLLIKDSVPTGKTGQSKASYWTAVITMPGGYAGGRSQREEVVPCVEQFRGRTALQQHRLRPLRQPQGTVSVVKLFGPTDRREFRLRLGGVGV